MKSFKKTLFYTLLITASVTLISCGVMRSTHYSSSAVQYLYPDQDDYIETPGIPRLSLPLKVGIAFVPEGNKKNKTLTERDKLELMNKVSKNFKNHNFVKSIELIPSAYLREKGSFANLDQLRTVYGIDVMALL